VRRSDHALHDREAERPFTAIDVGSSAAEDRVEDRDRDPGTVSGHAIGRTRVGADTRTC